ncbi:MAG: polysaccharide pyruvyl transferase family protein [Clostridiales bacterium]|nr:polysaccharide pyruvyl transferase family protein [Clostridiales bacterium]
MKNILICQHGGSANHGCEALVRGTVQLLRQVETDCHIELYSYRKNDDEKYLKDLSELHISGLRHLPGKYSPYNLRYHWQKRVAQDENASKIPLSAQFRQAVDNADLVVAIGGDNYCYNQGRGYWPQDRYIKKQGKLYVLLGASIEPLDLPGELSNHLRLFDLITVREPLSYNALKEAGLTNIIYCPDPAFVLQAEKTRIPAALEKQNIVGINLSPLIAKNANKASIAFDSCRALIKHILNNTKMQVALIPHVVWPGNDDRNILYLLKQEFGLEKRIILIEDHSARELKYIISKMRFFIGARTHSTIAAYSSHIPTLALGYSVKASGIAADLFGEDGDQYVVDVRELKDPHQLTQVFIRMMEKEQEIKTTLEKMMPAYKDLTKAAALYIERLLQGKELILPALGNLAAKSTCTGCGLCAAACENNAITMQASTEGFLYPSIDKEQCQHCSLCSQVCPAKQKTFAQPTPRAYAAFIKDEKTRLASSSGGIFTPLAQDLLKFGGYVCGAAYNDGLSVRHVIIEDAGDLPLLRGSKYAQSNLSEVYNPILHILEAGRPLLFVGTPCQTAAIRTWCGDNEFLLTVALACHGVPSPLLFNKYISEIEKKRGTKVLHVDFKNKSRGWRHAQTRLHFSGDNSFDDPNKDSAFMRAFLGNLCLRHSCHDCRVKNGAYADLLIGDYWGIEKTLPNFGDDKGISVVLSMSEKGRAALSGISDHIHMQETPFNDAWRFNPALVCSTPYNSKRQDFFAQLNNEPLADLVNHLLPQPTHIQKLKQRLQKLLRR